MPHITIYQNYPFGKNILNNGKGVGWTVWCTKVMLMMMMMIRCFGRALKYGSDHIYLTRMLRVTRRM